MLTHQAESSHLFSQGHHITLKEADVQLDGELVGPGLCYRNSTEAKIVRVQTGF